MKQENYQEFVCGYGAAVVTIGIAFPVNKVIFRQMLHGVNVRSAVEQLRTEGLCSLYRGVLPPLLQKSASLALMFGMFDQVYRYLRRHNYPSSRFERIAFIWLAGACSAGVECVLLPFERIQTLLQDPHYHSRFQNTFHAVKELYSYNIREYYRGLSAVYIRNCLSTGLFFSLREPIANSVLSVFHRYNKGSSSSEPLSFDSTLKPSLYPLSAKYLPMWTANFASGAILGASLSTIFYPLNVVRTRMQTYVGSEHHGLIATWRLIRAERSSILAMWRGVPLNFSRSLISWGIINSTYELLKTLFFPVHANKD